MHRKLVANLLLVTIFCFVIGQSNAELNRFLRRRYAAQDDDAPSVSSSPSPANENDNVTPTQKPAASNSNEIERMNANPARLYPDLVPSGPMGPSFKQPAAFQIPPSISRPTPFLPFGPSMFPGQNPGPLNANYQPNGPFGTQANNPNNPNRPVNEVFSSGLGERLLKLVNGNTDSTNGNSTEKEKVLRNATVLDQLNRGVHSVYDNLAKAYNSTIQKQVKMLQESLRNSTNGNSWQQAWGEQMNSFYKKMAERASKAQHDLNEAWNRYRNINASEIQKQSQQQQQQQANFLGLPTGNQDSFFPAGFARSMNLMQAPDSFPDQAPDQMSQNDMTRMMRDFWRTQVMPHMNQARHMLARTWNDMVASGALNPMMRRRGGNNNPNNNMSNSNSGASGDFVDDIMRSIDLGGPEYTIIDQNGSSSQAQAPHERGMADSMIATQRELNLLWKGITFSLQDALDNIRTNMHDHGMGFHGHRGPNNYGGRNKPTQSPTPAESSGSSSTTANNNSTETTSKLDTTENEISSKLRDINSLQSDADKVYDAVKREQYNQKIQEEQKTMSERVRNFYNNLNIDDNVNKIGAAVNNFWNQIPNNWNNMMNNMRPSTSSTAKPTEPNV